MSTFDPDKYLQQETPSTKGFDPDNYLKKKGEAISGVESEQSLERPTWASGIKSSVVDTPEQRTPSLSDLQKELGSLEGERESLREKIQAEESRELSPMERQVGNVRLSLLKQEEKTLSRNIRAVQHEAHALHRSRMRDITPEEEDAVNVIQSKRARLTELKQGKLGESGTLAGGMSSMERRALGQRAKVDPEEISTLKEEIRALEDAQRQDLTKISKQADSLAVEMQSLLSELDTPQRFDIRDKLLRGHEESPLKGIRDEFEKALGYDQGFLSSDYLNEVIRDNIREYDTRERLIEVMDEIEKLDEDVNFRINLIGEEYTTTSDLHYHNFMASIASSTASMAAYIGLSMPEWNKPVFDHIQEFAGGKEEKHLDYTMPFADYAYTQLGDFKFGQMTNPLWWEANGGALAGSMAFFAVPTFLGAMTANPIVAGAGLKGAAASWLGYAITSAVSTPWMAAVYGGQTYRDTREQLLAEGTDVEEAERIASSAGHKTFLTILPVSLALNTASYSFALKGVFSPTKELGRVGQVANFAKGGFWSGANNWYEENMARYRMESALGHEPHGMFSFDPVAMQNFASGFAMHTGNAGVGSVLRTVKGFAGDGSVEGYREISKSFLQAKLALSKETHMRDVTVQSMVNEKKLTPAEAAQFILEVEALENDDAFQKLSGVASIEYALFNEMAMEAERALQDNPDNEVAQKTLKEARTEMGELALHATSDLNVTIHDGEVKAYDMDGNEVREDDMNDKQKRHLTTVKKADSFSKRLREGMDDKYVVTSKGTTTTYTDSNELLDALQGMDVDDTSVVIHSNNTETTIALTDKVKAIYESKGNLEVQDTQAEIVAQEGDKAPLTESEAIDVSSQEALKDVESAVKIIEKEGVTVGEEMGKKTPLKVADVYRILEDEHTSQGGNWLDNQYGDAMFETKEQADAYAQEVYDYLVSLQDEQLIPVYRVVEAEEVDLSPYGIGESWSFSLDAVKEFAQQNLHGDKLKVISGYVPSENVNWEQAIRQYHNFSDITMAESEMEVPIQPNNKILGVRVTDIAQAEQLASVEKLLGTEAAPKEATEVVKTEPTEDAKPKTLLAQAQEEGVVAAFDVGELNPARQRLKDFLSKHWGNLGLNPAQERNAIKAAMDVSTSTQAEQLINRVLKQSTDRLQKAERTAEQEGIAESFKKHFNKLGQLIAEKKRETSIKRSEQQKAKDEKERQKFAEQSWLSFKRENKGLISKMPQRIQNMMRDKAFNIKDSNMEATLDFFQRVLTNQDYANSINEIIPKLEKFKKKPLGVFDAFIKDLLKLKPRARYLFGRDELKIMLGNLNIASNDITPAMMADLNKAMDALLEKTPDYAPMLEFMDTYSGKLDEATWNNITGVKVNEKNIIGRIDKVRTRTELLKNQLAEGEVNLDDITALVNEAKRIEAFLEKNQDIIQEIDGVFEGREVAQNIIDYLNTGYRELSLAAQETIAEAKDQLAISSLREIGEMLPKKTGNRAYDRMFNNLRRELNYLLYDNISKEDVDAIMGTISPTDKNRAKSAHEKAERISKNARENLDLGKLVGMKAALDAFNNGMPLNEIHLQAGISNVASSFKVAKILELTEPLRLLGNPNTEQKGFLSGIKALLSGNHRQYIVRKMIDSDKAFRQIYATLMDNKLGFDGLWNNPYWDAVGYDLDNAITIARSEVEKDTKHIVKAVTNLIHGAKLESNISREVSKMLGFDTKQSMRKMSVIGQVMASLSHYQHREVKIHARDFTIKEVEGQHIVYDMDNKELASFDTSQEARKYTDENKGYFFKDEDNKAITREDGEVYFQTQKEAADWIADNKELASSEFDTYAYATRKKWDMDAKLSPSVQKTNFLKDADKEAHEQLLGRMSKLNRTSVLVKTVDEAMAILEPAERRVFQEWMNLSQSLEEEARITTAMEGKPFNSMDFYYSFRNTSHKEASGRDVEGMMLSMVDNSNKGAKINKPPGYTHERKNQLQGYLDYNIMKNILGYAREVKTSLHVVPILRAEMDAFSTLTSRYKNLSDKESLKEDGTEAVSYEDIGKFVDNMKTDRLRRYRAEYSNMRALSDRSFNAFGANINMDGVLRRQMHVAKTRAMVDAGRFFLDALPQIARMSTELGIELRPNRVIQLSRMYEYLPEGSAMESLRDMVQTRYDYASSDFRDMPFTEWSTDWYLAQADRMTKQMGWAAKFDDQMETLFGYTLEGKNLEDFNNDENYRNALLNSPQFRQAVSAADKYVTSTHFARTTAASRGALMNGVIKAGTLGYKLYTPLLSYQLQALQQMHIGVTNAVANLTEDQAVGAGGRREIGRALGVAVNNVTYAYLSKMNRVAWAMLTAKSKRRPDEYERLQTELEEMFTWEALRANIMGANFNLMMSSGGAFGATMGNALLAMGEHVYLKTEDDPVTRREIQAKLKWVKDVSGTGFFPIQSLEGGEVSYKLLVDMMLPLLGRQLVDMVEGTVKGIAHVSSDDHLPKEWSTDLQDAYNAVGIVAMSITGALPLSKNVVAHQKESRRIARDRPYSSTMVNFMELMDVKTLIDQEIKRYTSDPNLYATDEKGVPIYINPDTGERVSMKQMADMGEDIPTQLQSFYLAQSFMDAGEMTMERLFDFADKPITYYEFLRNYNENAQFTKFLTELYPKVQNSKVLSDEEKFQVYKSIDKDAEELAKALWGGGIYVPDDTIGKWVENMINTLDVDIQLKVGKALFEADQMIKRYEMKKD